VTTAGLERFLSIALKSWLSVQMAILLTATTPLPDLLVAMRSLRLPRLLVAILGLMWRYLAVLGDEAMRMIRAREARSGSWTERSGGTLGWRASVTGAMAGSLFLRGYERSERIYDAMLARGYDGTIRSLPLRPVPSEERWLLLCALLGLLVLLVLGYLVG
jgi:cobalt/nickel transport system permease protein